MIDLSNLTHTARRDHRCAFCGLTVPTGQQYVRAQHPGGGRLEKRAFHSKCYTRLAASARKTNSAKE